MNQALREIGWELRENRLVPLVPVGASVRELFTPQQSQHDAYVEIRSILQKAADSVTIVDPYIDQSILTLLSTCVKRGMTPGTYGEAPNRLRPRSHEVDFPAWRNRACGSDYKRVSRSLHCP